MALRDLSYNIINGFTLMRSKYCLYKERIRIYGKLNGLSDPLSYMSYGVRMFTEPGVYYIYTLRGVIAIAIYVDNIVFYWFDENEISVRNRHISSDSNDSCRNSNHRNCRNRNQHTSRGSWKGTASNRSDHIAGICRDQSFNVLKINW